MKYVLKTLALILFVLVATLLLASLAVGIDQVAAWGGIDITDRTYGTIHQATFSIHRNLSFIVAAIVMLLALSAWVFVEANKFVVYTKLFGTFAKDNIVTTYRQVKESNVKYVLLIPLFTYIYFAITLPISGDEAYTYLCFVKPHWWTAATFYPVPNNHVLYSLLARISTSLPISSLHFAVRLPSIIISLLGMLVLYRFVRKFYSECMAVIIVALSAMTIMYIMYSFMARGYTLVSLCVILCLYMAFNIIYHGNRMRHWVVFAMSAIIGFYSIPTFLYPFIGINLFILYYNYKHIGKQIYYNLFVVFFTFLFYVPLIVGSGLNHLISNPYVHSIERSLVLNRMGGFISGAFAEIFGMPFYILLPIFAIAIAYTTIKKQYNLLLLWVVFCILPFVLMLVQSVIPFFRTFSYLGIVVPFLVLIPFRQQLERLSPKTILISILAIQSLIFIRFYSITDFFLTMHGSYNKVVDACLEDKKRYFVACELLEASFKFEAESRGYDIDYYQSDVQSIAVDTLSGFDYYIIQIDHDATKQRKPDTIVGGYLDIPLHIYKGKE